MDRATPSPLHLRWTLGLAAFSGILQVLTFPRFSYAWLAAFCVTPLLYALSRETRWKRRLAIGLLAGWIFWGGTCYWVYGVMSNYAGMAWWAAILIFIAFFLAKGIHLGVFAVLAKPLMDRPWALIAVPTLWVALEGTHQYLGFTWLLLGNASVDMSIVARSVPWFGVYGPSWDLMLANTALAALALGRPRKHLLWLGLLGALVLAPDLPELKPGTESVRLVQPNIHPDEMIAGRWTRERRAEHLARMRDLSLDPAQCGFQQSQDLIIWPEYPAVGYFFDSPDDRQRMTANARDSRAHWIFSSVGIERENGVRRPLNQAVVLDPEGRVNAVYSKQFLVPFGEFVPWPFSLFIQKITLEAGDFKPGEETVVGQVNGHGVGTFICYESVFARGVRRFVSEGAEVLVNISNDSWYGDTFARDQHLYIARMRAMENNRWILRATNDGYTTIIDPAGRVARPLPSFEDGVLCGAFNYESELTGFARYGQWFWYLCLAGTLVTLWFARVR